MLQANTTLFKLRIQLNTIQVNCERPKMSGQCSPQNPCILNNHELPGVFIRVDLFTSQCIKLYHVHPSQYVRLHSAFVLLQLIYIFNVLTCVSPTESELDLPNIIYSQVRDQY